LAGTGPRVAVGGGGENLKAFALRVHLPESFAYTSRIGMTIKPGRRRKNPGHHGDVEQAEIITTRALEGKLRAIQAKTRSILRSKCPSTTRYLRLVEERRLGPASYSIITAASTRCVAAMELAHIAPTNGIDPHGGRPHSNSDGMLTLITL